jgi:hypothetical protein
MVVGLLLPTVLIPIKESPEEPPSIKAVVEEYLKSKDSPLAEHVDVLLQQPHWELLIAVSNIESSWCTRKIDYNCWGIGGDSAYRHYVGYEEAIRDAELVIKGWQERGRWLTVDDMNCHYVVPCNQNWVNVVKNTLQEIEEIKK